MSFRSKTQRNEGSVWVHVISQVFLWAGLDAQACAVSEPALCGCADCSCECLYKIIISSSFSYKRTQCCPFRIEEKKKKTTQILQSSKIQRKRATSGFGNIKKEEAGQRWPQPGQVWGGRWEERGLFPKIQSTRHSRRSEVRQVTRPARHQWLP